MNLLAKLDDFLIDRLFQPFTHWFQKMFGLDNFWIAKVLASLIVPAKGIEMCLTDQPQWVVGTILAVHAAIVIFLWIPLCAKYERRTYEYLEFGVANPMRLYWWFRWLFILVIWFFALISSMTWFRAFDATAKSLLFYFVSCTPLPPSKSKLRQWLERFKLIEPAKPVTT